MVQDTAPAPIHSMEDPLKRTPISAGMKAMIADILSEIPEKKRGAVLVVHDFESNTTKAHLVAKLGEHWKVAAGAAFAWEGRKPTGFVSIGGSW